MHKLIGIFSENSDGFEMEDFQEMKERLGLIGSLSGDVGDIQLYYDNQGVTYAIAHGSETYYGTNEDGRLLALEEDDFRSLILGMIPDINKMNDPLISEYGKFLNLIGWRWNDKLKEAHKPELIKLYKACKGK